MTEQASAGLPPPFGLCPHCRSGDVIRVKSVRGSRNVIPIKTFMFAAVGRLVCLSCGYVRDWIEQPGDLQKLRERYGWQLRPR
jgi:hypothetical protein